MKIKQYIFTIILMAIGLILFKYIPMQIYGDDILFDASMHMVVASSILYLLYLLFVDRNKDWRMPYIMFSCTVLFIIAVQRILDNQHNDIGLLMGLLVALFSIFIPRRKEIKK
jgi:hypothetical protein